MARHVLQCEFFLTWERDVLSVHLNMCSCVWHVLLIFQLDTTMATKIATLVLRLFYIDCNRARVQVRQWSIIILCIKIKTIDSHSVQYDRQSRGMANVTKFVAYRIRIVRSNMHKKLISIAYGIIRMVLRHRKYWSVILSSSQVRELNDKFNEKSTRKQYIQTN